jgi:hypothetical protein
MKILNLSVGTMIMRLHLMCAIMVTLGFFGLMYVGIVVGMVLFLATLMGIKFSHLNIFRHLPKHGDYDWQHRHHPVHH